MLIGFSVQHYIDTNPPKITTPAITPANIGLSVRNLDVIKKHNKSSNCNNHYCYESCVTHL